MNLRFESCLKYFYHLSHTYTYNAARERVRVRVRVELIFEGENYLGEYT